MAAVLGVSAYYHDAAAALVVDGRVVAAIQEERLSRVKNDASLPTRAIDACLTRANIDREALDRVVFYENPYRKLERVLVDSLGGFPRGATFFRRALRSQLGEKLWVLDALATHCKIDRSRVVFVDHHASHAASALHCAPFEDAVAITVDGVGEDETTAIWGAGVRRLASIGHPHSLGLFYAGITAYLGFRVNEGEFKVMGLAAYGEPRFGEEMDALLRRGEAGAFQLDVRAFGGHRDAERAFGPALEDALGPARAHRKPWDLSTADDQRYADVAASAQAALEEAMLGLATEAHRRTGATSLALAGGVALNCRANGRLLRESEFERIYVQPAAGDAGGALGAALIGAIDEGDSLDARALPAGLGVEPDASRAHAIATHLGLSVERVEDPARVAADAIAKGELVAWVNGPSEWGPRALGHRSVLARPDSEAIRDALNRRIKGREVFRPFAPALLDAQARTMLVGAPNDMTPRMTTTCDVVEGAELAGCTHVDGTARAQTVAADGVFGGLLRMLEDAHGVRGVLNTSLNVAGEPMVAVETDALDFLVRRKPDALMIDDVWIRRPSS